ncbi:hypothetical protein FPSE5266_08927 [Fusarium pseudograminearum]|nr:hypothetical protein FPSE5266_08927 [Fusarium pseudograminearum]
MDSDQLSPNTRSLRSRSNVTYYNDLPPETIEALSTLIPRPDDGLGTTIKRSIEFDTESRDNRSSEVDTESKNSRSIEVDTRTKNNTSIEVDTRSIEVNTGIKNKRPMEVDTAIKNSRSIEVDTRINNNRSIEVNTGTKNNGSIVVDTGIKNNKSIVVNTGITNKPVAKPSDTTLEATGSTTTESPLLTIAKIKAKIATEHAYSKVLTQSRRRLWEQMESYEAHIREHQSKICDSGEGKDLLNKRLRDCEILESQIAEICKLLESLGENLDESANKVVDLLNELSKAR